MEVIRMFTRAAGKAADWIANPGGLDDDAALIEAVAGKVIVVTGASYGLGEATARALGRAGATVLLAARTAERLESVAAEINDAGGSAYAYPTNLADPDEAGQLAKTVLTEHGHVDVLVSNAGKSIRRSVALQYDRFTDFERTNGVNYLGPVRLVLGLLPSMRERGVGHIVNVSTAGVRIAPGPRWGAYQASKGAFNTWLHSVTPEIEPDGVTVSTIYLTLVHTRMSAPTPSLRRLPGMRPEEAADLVAKAIVRRPAEIAPWWLGPAELGSVALRRPVSWGLGLAYRSSSDSPSARDPRPSGGERA